MNRRFYRLVDRTQFIALLTAVFLIPLVFFIGEQNTFIYSLLSLLGFPGRVIGQGNQNIVLLKPMLAQVFVFFAFCLWLIESMEREQFKLPSTSLNGPLVVWTLWMVGTIFAVSSFWHAGLEEMGRYLAVILLFFLVQKLVHDRARLKWFLWALIAAAIISTGIGWLQYLGRPLYDWGQSQTPLVSTFGNKNFFAGFLVLTIPSFFGFLMATRKLPLKIILLVLVGLESFILLATGTKTGLLSLVASASVFLLLMLRFFVLNSLKKIPASWFVIAVIIVVVILGLVYVLSPEGIVEGMLQVFDIHRGTQRVRWIMWTGSTRAALDQPLVGHGHGSFQLVFPNYRPTFYHRFLVSHNTRHSHNEYLEVLMETGLIGLALFLTLMIVYSVLVYRFLRRSSSWFYSWLVVGFSSSIYGSLIQNFASVNFRWMSTTFTFWLIFALTLAAIRLACNHSEYRRKRQERQKISSNQRILPPLSWKSLGHGAVVVAFVLFGIQAYSALKADFYLKRMNTLIRMAESNRGGVNWEHAEQAGETSIEYNPYHLSALYKLAYVYLGQGKYKQAGRTYDRLTDLAPNYAQVHNNIALVHQNLNRPYRRLLHFEWATSLEDNRRNHLNLVERYTSEDFSERALYHTLYIPRIVRENVHDKSHLISRNLANGKFGRYKDNDRGGAIEKNYDDLHSAYQILSDRLGERRGLRNLISLKTVSENPSGQTALAIMTRFSRQGDFTPSPLVLLAAAKQLRESDDPRKNSVVQHYMQLVGQWLNKNQDRPLWKLAYAHLLVQAGRGNQARQLVREPENSWMEEPYFKEAVEYVRQKSEE